MKTPFCGKGDCVWPHQQHQNGQRSTASDLEKRARESKEFLFSVKELEQVVGAAVMAERKRCAGVIANKWVNNAEQSQWRNELMEKILNPATEKTE